MEIEQTTELTYTKVEDIDKKINEILDIVTDSNPESSNTLKDLVNEVKTDTETIETKVETIIENLENQTELDTTVLETQISQISTDITTLNTTITDMSDDLTTTNSNVSTIKTNTNNIRSNVEYLKENLPVIQKYNVLDSKLNEILRLITRENNETTFETDPFKLSLDYTERLELHRNPSNYDFIEIDKEFVAAPLFFAGIAHCEDNTIHYKVTMRFTAESSFSLGLNCSAGSISPRFEAGTHDYVYETDATITNNKIHFNYQCVEGTIFHYFKIEVTGNNAILLPKKQKYRIFNSCDKIAISKVENNNGYYLILNNSGLLPYMLNKEYTLAKEQVKDFEFGLDFILHNDNKYAIGQSFTYIDLSSIFYYNYYDNLVTGKLTARGAYCCCLSYYDKSKLMGAIISNNGAYRPTLSVNYGIKYSNQEKTDAFKQTYLTNVTQAKDLYKYDSGIVQVNIVTDVSGINYMHYNSVKYLDIGYGKYTTAYYDKDNPNLINVYMNDNGYCVKKQVLFNDDKTFTLLNQRIIGTYDAYFETNSDIYFVEKDKQLYMFKK